MNDINPNDIERIEIIKGAAAATLYGTEAAAGVIQIFTKSGRAGKPQWTLQTDQGFVHSLPFGPDPSTAPPGDTIPKIYRDSFPSRFAGLPRPRRLARRRNVELPVHRSVAPQRPAAALLALGRRRRRGPALLRVRRGDERRRRAAERQRSEDASCAATSRSRRSPTCCSPGTRRTRRTTSATRRPATTRTGSRSTRSAATATTRRTIARKSSTSCSIRRSTATSTIS